MIMIMGCIQDVTWCPSPGEKIGSDKSLS